MFKKIKQLIAHIIPAILRPLRVLWNEVIGFVFLALAVWAVPSSIRAYHEYAANGDGDSLFRVVLAAMFAVLMIWFGVTSFLRARRIGRP